MYDFKIREVNRPSDSGGPPRLAFRLCARAEGGHESVKHLTEQPNSQHFESEEAPAALLNILFLSPTRHRLANQVRRWGGGGAW